MGFFDRFAAKKPASPATPQTPPQTAAAESESSAESTPAGSAAGPSGSVKTQLASAREKLDAQDVAGAMAIYEELLRAAGDRPDVLVTLSGDLGTCGYVEQIVELVAPRYDAERHGPATGINLLQAYLAVRNTQAAQHLLDILFALKRPELEQRLYGFSNALAELIEAERRGQLPPPDAPANAEAGGPAPGPQKAIVSLVTISKPIWTYGIETLPGILPPKADRLRRIAFAQLSLIGLPDAAERMKKPEDSLARLSRGFPLWMADLFTYSPNYAPVAAIGTMNKEHYVIFGAEWTANNLRELVQSNKEPIDYVFTGTLREQAQDHELTIKVWEIKRFRERKAFTVRWTPATADAELTKLAETIRMFMEWSAYPADAALPYAMPASPSAWCDTLGSSVSFFLADKGVVPKSVIEDPASDLARVGERAATSERDSLAYLTLVERAIRLGIPENAAATAPLFTSPLVEEAGGLLGL
ncbi:hypothetical protein DB347_17030 [Opitutaceae bacterium EW11]|nr:hypothetical protein DB347_17030 [Opitutaceae bacterium EW11]